ncbi:MAG TPA: hypothetical protein VMB18_06820 [Terriglobales bacterium]|nr:hypothetical protein [Terriglobales bacterium]
MRYAAFLLLLAAASFGQTSAPPSQSVPADQENANKARLLINQAIEALGGDAYLNIQDIKQEGRTYSLHNGEAEGTGILFWRFYKYPDKERIELTKQRDVVYIYRGDEGFEITFKGTRAEDAKTLQDYNRRRRYALDYVLREWLKEPGIALFYEGPTVAAQKDAQQVTIMDAKNDAVTLYFDSNTHLPIKKSYSWRDPTDKERNVEEEIFDAYRPVQGIMTPFSVSRYYNGAMANQRFLHAVSYNQGLSDSLFEASITNEPNKASRK